ncbi:hypothetical protein ACFV4F_14795 [Kitasatospora sp. NPDC059722]|uniref:hypothetical protein n=1 Tax=unclassified Kitasatospora TaxID=2633591 RepID=UPI00365B4112
MGRRLVGAAVAGVVAFGGAVAVAGPAEAVPVVRTAAVVSGDRAPVPARASVGGHHVTDVAVTRHKSKRRNRGFVSRTVGRSFGFVWVLLFVVLLVVILVLVSRRGRR